MTVTVSSCSQTDFCGVEKERRQTETDTDTGKVKHNILSAVMGTWECSVDIEEKQLPSPGGGWCQG